MADMDSLAVDDVPELVNISDSEQSDRARLADLIAQATSKYAVKDYAPAADLYSEATELQAQLNGDMAIENADLLYSFGKCLYFVAVSNSDVLGAKKAGEKVGNLPNEQGKKPKAKRKPAPIAESAAEQIVAEGVVAKIATEKDPGADDAKEESQEKSDSKPFFQFTGDENWDDSDDEDVDEAANEEEEEEDDFQNAFEILDLARVLLNQKLEHLQQVNTGSSGNGKNKEELRLDSSELRQTKERLADTQDLQAEISLEAERYPNAVVDLRSSLALKQELYPQESSQIAECHYKLSLALEFSSVTQQKDENGESLDGQKATVDEEMRKEAATEMEKAIESCKLRIAKEQAELDTHATDEAKSESKSKITQQDIDEVKEVVADMQERLVDLRTPPVAINDPTSTGTLDGSNPLNGILGQILGESPEQQKARLEEANRTANDVSGLVRKKKAATKSVGDTNGTGEASASSTSNAKRKADDGVEVAAETVLHGKKARVDEASRAA